MYKPQLSSWGYFFILLGRMADNNNYSPKRFYVLDGLRGMLAFTVVAFHLLQVTFTSRQTNPLHHAYLAVDFFFLLSGWVLTHAYHHKWEMIPIKQFFKTRLIRLHPMAFAGVLLGLIAYWFAFRNDFIPTPSAGQLCLMLALQIFLLPSPDYLHEYPVTHALNPPIWSLFQEYLVNGLFALTAKKGKTPLLISMLVVSGASLIFIGIAQENLNGGWDWNNFWVAPLRAFYSFFAGVCMYRFRLKVRLQMSIPIFFISVFCLLAAPIFPLNGLYDAVCILFLFPILLLTGASLETSRFMERSCRLLGELSYPIYLTHYPIVTIYWFLVHKSTQQFTPLKWGMAITFLVITLLSLLILRLYDKPVRRWLSKKFQST